MSDGERCFGRGTTILWGSMLYQPLQRTPSSSTEARLSDPYSMQCIKKQPHNIKASAQARLSSDAPEAAVVTTRNSNLVNVPAELLYEIFKSINISDTSMELLTMIPRATCHRSRCFFPDPLATMEPATKSVLQQRYSYFLRSRRLDGLVRSKTSSCLVCIACMRLLPRKLFFSRPIEPPNERRCKGHEGELKFFGRIHEILTWDKLHTGELQYWRPPIDFLWSRLPATDGNLGVGWYDESERDARLQLSLTDTA